MIIIATMMKLMTMMPSVEPISERSALGWGVAVVCKSSDALEYSLSLSGWPERELLNATLIKTSVRLMNSSNAGRINFFMGRGEYNMRTERLYVLACPFAV